MTDNVKIILCLLVVLCKERTHIMRSTVSVRWQTVIPRQIRETMKIEPQMKLDWELKDGMIIIHPIPSDPVGAARGMLKGRGPTTRNLLAERQLQRKKERKREKA